MNNIENLMAWAWSVAEVEGEYLITYEDLSLHFDGNKWCAEIWGTLRTVLVVSHGCDSPESALEALLYKLIGAE